MSERKVPIQSLIDHIKTAIDVDDWAKELAEELLGEYVHTKEEYRRTKVEFIESYIKFGDADYQWSDNHGELIRCKNCIHWQGASCPMINENGSNVTEPDWYCANGEKI